MGLVVSKKMLVMVDLGKIDVIVILRKFSPMKQFHLKLTMNLAVIFTSLD